MVSTSTRKVLGILLVSLMVMFAGCSGSGLLGGDQTEEAADETDEPEETEGTDTNNTTTTAEQTEEQTTDEMVSPPETPDTPDTGGTDVPDMSASTYDFSEGESYTYNVTFLGSSSVYTWDVVSTSGSQLTVDVTAETTRSTQSATISGTQSTIIEKAGQNQTAALFSSARAPMAIASMGDLSAGNYTIQSSNLPNGDSYQWDSATVSPQGTETVDGVPCTAFTVHPSNSQQTLDSCVADGYPFALSLGAEQSGQVILDMEMTDSTRP